MLRLSDLITPSSPERRPVRPVAVPDVDPGIFEEDALSLADALEARRPDEDAGVLYDRP